MKRIKQWWIRRRFKKALSHIEQGIKESQEFVEFIDLNWELLFGDESDWIISKSEIIGNTDALIAGLAQIDQIQTKHRKVGEL